VYCVSDMSTNTHTQREGERGAWGGGEEEGFVYNGLDCSRSLPGVKGWCVKADAPSGVGCGVWL